MSILQMPNNKSANPQSQRWIRAGSLLIGFAAVTLFATAFGVRFYSSSLSSILLILVLVALTTAIGLHARFLILAGREHRGPANARDAPESEYKAVFDNSPHRILIPVNCGVCPERTPSALGLLV